MNYAHKLLLLFYFVMAAKLCNYVQIVCNFDLLLAIMLENFLNSGQRIITNTNMFMLKLRHQTLVAKAKWHKVLSVALT